MKRKLMLVGAGCLALGVTVWAAGKPQSKSQTVAARGTLLTVGSPLTQGNMTVFPIYSRERREVSSEYLTLDEALKEKLIVVREMPDAEVNRVSVTNTAGKPIYLMAGDIILGGQQDREVSRDTIVPQGAKNFAVQVFCVEHGRWSGGQHFSGGEVASGKLRQVTQQAKEQQKVWDRVADEARSTRAATPSGTYRAVARNEANKRNVDAYVKTLGVRLAKDKRAIGVVVAINGEVTAADVFADRKLFEKQVPKILKSYALDAAQSRDEWAKQPRKAKPTMQQATTLLRDAERGRSRTTAQSQTTVNTQRESDSTVVFEAGPAGVAGGGAAAASAHRNIYRKK